MNWKKGIVILLTGLFSLEASAQVATIPAIKVEELVEQYKNAPGITVVNFWSTWCKPCTEEIPGFIKTVGAHKPDSVHLWLVSLDTKSLYTSGKLSAFVQKKNWQNARMIWLNETNAEHYCPLVDENWSGVIPVTLIIYPAKNYYRFYEQSLTSTELEAAIAEAIKGR